MKAAAVVYEFPSLTETFVQSQITGLRKLGCDVQVLADSPDPLATTDGQSGITYYGLPFRRLRDAIGNVGLSHRAISRDTSIGHAGRLRYRIESIRVKRMRFDIVHSHFGQNGVRAVAWRSQGAINAPVITSFYGYDVSRYGAQRGYGTLFDEGELFLVLSRQMENALIELGCPRDRLRIHPLGVDLNQFRPTPRVARSHMEILSVARLVPKKGLEFALDAVALLVDRGVKVRYTIAGDGPLRRRLMHKCRTLRIERVVTFDGPLDGRSILDKIREADVLLAPSITADDGDMEGTPMAILEAQACGLPVVATRHAGIPEIVPHGLLAEERDSNTLADLLAELAESPSRRAEIGAAGRSHVEERHDICHLNRELLDLYESLRRC